LALPFPPPPHATMLNKLQTTMANHNPRTIAENSDWRILYFLALSFTNPFTANMTTSFSRKPYAGELKKGVHASARSHIPRHHGTQVFLESVTTVDKSWVSLSIHKTFYPKNFSFVWITSPMVRT